MKVLSSIITSRIIYTVNFTWFLNSSCDDYYLNIHLPNGILKVQSLALFGSRLNSELASTTEQIFAFVTTSSIVLVR